MITIEKLKEFGADTADGLKRCLNMEDFYLDLVNSSIDDTQLVQLGKAISAKELDSAFETAHSLKGVYGNLSLTPLYKPMSELTELLRSKTAADYDTLYNEIMRQFEKLKALAE